VSASDAIRRQNVLVCLRARLLWLVGALSLLIVAITVWGLLAVDRANQRQKAALDTAAQLLEAIDLVRHAQIDFKQQVQEWKNVLLRGGNPADYARYWASFESEEKQLASALEQARKELTAQQLRTAPIDDFLASHARLDTAYRLAIKNYRPGDAASVVDVDQQVRGIDREPTDKLDAYVAELEIAARNRFADLDQASQDRVDFDKKFREAILLAVTAGLVLAVLFSMKTLARVESILESGETK
jgi:hypothetical protein